MRWSLLIALSLLPATARAEIPIPPVVALHEPAKTPLVRPPATRVAPDAVRSWRGVFFAPALGPRDVVRNPGTLTHDQVTRVRRIDLAIDSTRRTLMTDLVRAGVGF